MDWILYVALTIGGTVLFILITELSKLISEAITHIRWMTKAEEELRFRIGELEKKVFGSDED